MKKIFIAIVALAAATACSNSEIVSVNREAIAFDNAFVNNSTRSVIDPSFTNTNLFEDFAVYGFVTDENTAPIFDRTKVSGSALNGDWTYEGTQYWITGAKYNFAAIAPFANGKSSVFSVAADADNNYVGTTTLPFTNVDGTNDLLYAQNAQIVGASSGNNSTVEFNFRHILSKVKFSFKNAYNASTATIKVYDVKIENAWESATATLGETSTAWGSHAGDVVLSFGNASDDEATTDVKEEDVEVAYAYGKTYETLNERLLIPGVAPEVTGVDNVTNAYKVTFKVDLLVNGTKIKDYAHTAYVEFAPVAGYSYDIKAEINADNIDPENEQDPIEFTVTSIGGWETTDQNKTM